MPNAASASAPLRFCLGLCLCLCATLASAQVQHPGSPSVLEPVSPPSSAGYFAVPPADAPNATLLATEDKAMDAAKNRTGGKRVGAVVPLPEGAPRSLRAGDFARTISSSSSSTVWRLTVRSPRALGMGVNFARFDLPKGASLFVYSSDKAVVRGAFTAWNHKPNGEFAILPVPGDSITIEVVAPAAGPLPDVVVASVVHHYVPHGLIRGGVNSDKGFGDSGYCNVNSACAIAAEYRNQVKGVSLILTSSGSALCSGSLINNVEEDGKQLYLTANHCGTSNANNWIFVFNYESSECSNPARDPGTADSVQGSTLKATTGSSDFGLLELTERIPASYKVFLNGFDASDDASFPAPFSISHPSGDIKKVAKYGGLAVPEGYFNPGDTHWLIAEWDEGVTEGGSSGSPIFDDRQRIRGQLHGGYAACSYLYIDYYGRLQKSWDAQSGSDAQLQPHLDPRNTGTRVVDGTFLNLARANQKK